MLTGSETLELIVENALNWADTHDRDPTTVFLPVRMAWNLAKCRPEDLGDVARQAKKRGVVAFEDVGILGLKVEIVREPAARLRME